MADSKPEIVDRMPSGLPLKALPMYSFLHVPKTAGTSLNAVISGMFAGFVCWHQTKANQLGGDDKFAAAIAADEAFYDELLIAIGHFGVRHPLVTSCKRRAVLMAVLRNSLERIVSLYDYIRHREDHPIHQETRKRTLLQAFRDLPSFRANASNAQLQQVFGAVRLADVEDALKRRNYLIGRFDHLREFVARQP